MSSCLQKMLKIENLLPNCIKKVSKFENPNFFSTRAVDRQPNHRPGDS